LTDSERDRQFPAKRLALREARKLNKKAYKARKAGDNQAAITNYRAAIAAAPGYVPSRFNLACELALKGNADAAIEELEQIFKIGTMDARKYLSKTRVDTDFDPIRNDPRMKRIAADFQVDYDAAILKQLCADAGKVGTMVDAEIGLYTLDKRDEIKHVDGGKARGAVYDVLFVNRRTGTPGFCTKYKDDNDVIYGPPDSKLSKWDAKGRRCMEGQIPSYYPSTYKTHYRGEDGGATAVRGLLCFYKHGDRWLVGVAEVGYGYFEEWPAKIKKKAAVLFN
jgi:hypothetical protein